jgi:hypothetical protein
MRCELYVKAGSLPFISTDKIKPFGSERLFLLPKVACRNFDLGDTLFKV